MKFDNEFTMIAIALLAGLVIGGGLTVVLFPASTAPSPELVPTAVPPQATPQATPEPTPVLPGEQQGVCGNGIVEPGETISTCCEDTGCPYGMVCEGLSCEERPTRQASFGEQFFIEEGDLAYVDELMAIYYSRNGFVVMWPDGIETTEDLVAGGSASRSYVNLSVVPASEELPAALLVSGRIVWAWPGEFFNAFEGEAARISATPLYIGVRSVSGGRAVLDVMTFGEGSEEATLGAEESFTTGEYTITAVSVRENGSVTLLVTM